MCEWIKKCSQQFYRHIQQYQEIEKGKIINTQVKCIFILLIGAFDEMSEFSVEHTVGLDLYGSNVFEAQGDIVITLAREIYTYRRAKLQSQWREYPSNYGTDVPTL